MSPTDIPVAGQFLAGSILSLVLPVAVVIVVLTWYWVVWRKGTEERAAREQARGREEPG